MSNEHYSYVKCCSDNKNNIYFWFSYNAFFLHYGDVMIKEPIEYCPWCGILLDTNLLKGDG